jgi:RNA polymerase sigma factor (sigma-70 family)
VSNLSENELVKQCINQSRSAQLALYQKYSDAMFNTCCRMLPVSSDAEETLQDAFVTIFEKIDTFSFQSTLGAWIKRIVVNKCIDQLRLKKQMWAELNEQMSSIPDQAEEPISVNMQVVNDAIIGLPDGYRTVFSLYAIEGYDHEEIAQILNISEQTSKSQYHRAKEKLKTTIASSGNINKLYN